MNANDQPHGRWYRRADSNSVLIFIHGINSDSDKCWRAGDAYWPDLVSKETDFATMGIYLFSYRSNRWSADYSIDDAVDALEEFVVVHGLLHFKNVIFLAHSMGGIVARRFLVQNHMLFQKRSIRVGLFLVASPSRGSKFADWLKHLLRIVNQSQALGLQTLAKNPWLRTLDEDFQNLLSSGQLNIVGKELIEDLPFSSKLPFLGSVVRSDSGACYFSTPVKVPGSDHFTIAAPGGSQAFQHVVLKGFLQDIVDSKASSPELSDRLARGLEERALDQLALVATLDIESLLENSSEIERLFSLGAIVKSFRLAKTLTQLLLTDLSINDRTTQRWLRLRVLSNSILFGIRSASYLPQKSHLLKYLVDDVQQAAENNFLLNSVVPEIVLELVAINQGSRNYRVGSELINQVRLVSSDPVLQTKIRSRMFMADLGLNRSADINRAILRENIGQPDRKHDLRLPMMLAWDALRSGSASVARTILEEAEQQLTKAVRLYGPDAYDPMIQLEARLSLKSAIRSTEHSRTEEEKRNDDALWTLYNAQSRQQSIMLRPNLWDLIGGFDLAASRNLVWEIQELHGRYNQMNTAGSELLNGPLEEATVRLVRLLSARYSMRTD